MNTSITAVITYYNIQENYFESCFRSVITQTSPVEKIVIVDDGSYPPLETRDFYSTLVTYAKCKVFKLDSNLGVAAARAYGFALCGTPWILTLDGDDEIDEQFVANWRRQIWCYTYKPMWFPVNPQRVTVDLLLRRNVLSSCAILSAEAYGNTGGWIDPTNGWRHFEDWYMWLRMVTLFGQPGFLGRDMWTYSTARPGRKSEEFGDRGRYETERQNMIARYAEWLKERSRIYGNT